MPGRVVLFQREIELECRDSTGIALYSRQFAAHAVRFEADKQRTASEISKRQFFKDIENLDNILIEIYSGKAFTVITNRDTREKFNTLLFLASIFLITE